jgi:hypothetical protein
MSRRTSLALCTATSAALCLALSAIGLAQSGPGYQCGSYASLCGSYRCYEYPKQQVCPTGLVYECLYQEDVMGGGCMTAYGSCY